MKRRARPKAKPRLRPGLSQAELNQRLSGPIPLQLQGLDLSGLDLGGRDLKGANLEGAILRRTFLERADLRGAILENACLNGTLLSGAKLWDADLRCADLTEANGLQTGQLAGADLSDARLGESLDLDGEVVGVAEIARVAERLFITMLLVCVYAWQTIALTTDLQLLTNSASFALPVVQTGLSIPIVSFFQLAPFLLLGFYVFFHIHLQRLWEGLASLPAIFPDGRTVDRRTTPSIFYGLVWGKLERLRGMRSASSWVQKMFTVVLIWGVAPLAIAYFWVKYLRLHDWDRTLLHIFLLTLALSYALWTYHLAGITLRKEDRDGSLRAGGMGVAAPAIFIALTLFSYGAINGIPNHIPGKRLAPPPAYNAYSWMPHLLKVFRCSPFVDLQDTDITIKPLNWTDEKPGYLKRIKGSRLGDVDLRYGHLDGAFLLNAKMKGANFYGASLEGADLRGADLQKATLVGSDLIGADFKEADLECADLRNADLRSAKGLTPRMLESALMDSTTACPEDLSTVCRSFKPLNSNCSGH